MADGIAASHRPPDTPDPHQAHLTRMSRRAPRRDALERRDADAGSARHGAQRHAAAGRPRRAAGSLAGEGIEAIFASDLEQRLRHRAGAWPRVGLPITTDVGLRERSFGVFQGYTYSRHRSSAGRSRRARWRHHDPRPSRPKAARPLREFSARASRGLRPARRPSTGGPLRSPSSPTAASSTASTAPPPASGSTPRARGSSAMPAINRLLYTPRGLHPGRLERHRPPRRRDDARRRQRGGPRRYRSGRCGDEHHEHPRRRKASCPRSAIPSP